MKKHIVAGIVLPIALFSSYNSAFATNDVIQAPTTQVATKSARATIRDDAKALKDDQIALAQAIKENDKTNIGILKAKVSEGKKKLKSDTLALRSVKKVIKTP